MDVEQDQSIGKESFTQDLSREVNKWNVNKSRSEGIIWRIGHNHGHKITMAPMAGACRKNTARQVTEDDGVGNNWCQEKERKAEIEMVE